MAIPDWPSPRWPAAALLTSSGLSGGALWLAQGLAARQDEPPAWLGAALTAHGLSAALALVLFGWILAAHLPGAWRQRRHRRSGLLLLGVLTLLCASGWGLYYTASESLRAILVWAHQCMGIGLVLAYGIHGWQHWRRRG